MKSLEQAPFPEIAERISALYNEDEDALLLGMLGQDYVIRRSGITLHGQKAPDSHAAVIMDYLFSPGSRVAVMPWRAIGDFSGTPVPEFRKRAELPLTQYVGEVTARASAVLPLLDAEQEPSIIGTDMAITVRALPNVYLHVEMSEETQDFPADAWILFSNNADDFLTVPSMQALAEIFKDRLLSMLRIY